MLRKMTARTFLIRTRQIKYGGEGCLTLTETEWPTHSRTISGWLVQAANKGFPIWWIKQVGEEYRNGDECFSPDQITDLASCYRQVLNMKAGDSCRSYLKCVSSERTREACPSKGTREA